MSQSKEKCCDSFDNKSEGSVQSIMKLDNFSCKSEGIGFEGSSGKNKNKKQQVDKNQQVNIQLQLYLGRIPPPPWQRNNISQNKNITQQKQSSLRCDSYIKQYQYLQMQEIEKNNKIQLVVQSHKDHIYSLVQDKKQIEKVAHSLKQ